MHVVRRLIVICALVSGSAAALLGAPQADASCIAALVVEGRVLIGQGSVAASHLPRAAGKHPAVEPACNDAGQDDPDRAITVRTLEGLPPDVAVVRRGEPTELYVAAGSLLGSSAHPLHRAVYGRGTRRSRRPQTCRREPRAVRGALVDESPWTGPKLALRTGRGTTVIATDARTRLTNRPAYEPLNPGQRLAVRTSICGSRRVADAIAFVGATVPLERVDTDTGGGVVGTDLDPRWIVGLAYVMVMVALLLAARRLGSNRG